MCIFICVYIRIFLRSIRLDLGKILNSFLIINQILIPCVTEIWHIKMELDVNSPELIILFI